MFWQSSMETESFRSSMSISEIGLAVFFSLIFFFVVVYTSNYLFSSKVFGKLFGLAGVCYVFHLYYPPEGHNWMLLVAAVAGWLSSFFFPRHEDQKK